MSAKRNLQLITPYLVSSLEGVSHGFYLLWLTVHRGVSPFAAATMLAAGDLTLLVLDVPAGIFADRLGVRRSLLLGSGSPSRSATRSVTAPTRRWSTDRAPRSVKPLRSAARGRARRAWRWPRW
jgi:MFS family permease